MSSDLIQQALEYGSLGWNVIPVRGKVPIGTDWPNRASPDDDTIKTLFADPSADGVGVLLGQRSGLIDFDCDNEQAQRTYEDLFHGFEEIQPPMFQSSRGYHYLWRWSADMPQDVIKIVVDGLEIRVGGDSKVAQTVFPPSGGRCWIDGARPTDVDVPEIPAEVIRRINERWKAMQDAKKAKETQTNGSRTTTETGIPEDGELRVEAWLSKHGQVIIENEVSVDIRKWFIRCPGFELHTTKNSPRDCVITQDTSGKMGGCCFHSSCGMSDWQALKSAIGEPKYDDYHEIETYPEIDLSGILNPKPVVVVPPEPEKPIPKQPSSMSESFFEVPGLIGSMIAYHRAIAPRPRPELSLAASIALVGTLAGRKIQYRSGMRTNIYAMGLAPSGSGKDGPRLDNINALTEAGLQDYLGPEAPSSDSALIGDLHTNPSLLMQSDEVSHYFSSLKGDHSSAHLKNIKKCLLELVGAASNPAWCPKSWADGQKKKVINHPNLSIYGTATATGFWDSVTTGDAVDGFLARMMIVETSEDHPRLRDIPYIPPPSDVIDIIKDWHAFFPGKGNIKDQYPIAQVIYVDSAAQDRIHSHSEGVEDRLNDDDPGIRAIWARASALVKRLCLIYSASRGPSGIAVTLEDAERAVKLANWTTRLLIRRVFTHVSTNEVDREKKKVLDIIRKNGGSITGTALNRLTQWIKDANARKHLLQELMEAEYIERTVGESTGGRQAFIYKITSAA